MWLCPNNIARLENKHSKRSFEFNPKVDIQAMFLSHLQEELFFLPSDEHLYETGEYLLRQNSLHCTDIKILDKKTGETHTAILNPLEFSSIHDLANSAIGHFTLYGITELTEPPEESRFVKSYSQKTKGWENILGAGFTLSDTSQAL